MALARSTALLNCYSICRVRKSVLGGSLDRKSSAYILIGTVKFVRHKSHDLEVCRAVDCTRDTCPLELSEYRRLATEDKNRVCSVSILRLLQPGRDVCEIAIRPDGRGRGMPHTIRESFSSEATRRLILRNLHNKRHPRVSTLARWITDIKD